MATITQTLVLFRSDRYSKNGTISHKDYLRLLREHGKKHNPSDLPDKCLPREDRIERFLNQHGFTLDENKVGTPEDRKLRRRITARQIGGDDGYQYNVLIDGRSFVSGLTFNEVPHYKLVAFEKLKTGNY